MGDQGVSLCSRVPVDILFGVEFTRVCWSIGGLTIKGRCKNYEVAEFYPARAVAIASLFLAMDERGLSVGEGKQELQVWIDDVSGGKVDIEDFWEVVGLLRKSEG